MREIEWGPRPTVREAVGAIVSGMITGLILTLMAIGLIAVLATLTLIAQDALFFEPGTCSP